MILTNAESDCDWLIPVPVCDVVGLGKTLMATALAKVFQNDQFTETLIVCPKNLVKMILIAGST